MLKRCNQAHLWSQTLSKQMEIILSGEAGSYRWLTVGEYTFCMCMFFKHNKFRVFFGVFWIDVFICHLISRYLHFKLTCGPEPANEDIYKDNSEAWVKILQSNAGTHNLFIRVYATGSNVWCALDLGEISGFSGVLECTLFCMAEICGFCVHVHRYCCMSQYCLNWRIWVQSKILLNWTDKFCGSVLILKFSVVCFKWLKERENLFITMAWKGKSNLLI